MKQLALDLRTGKVMLHEVPAPLVRKGCVLIRTRKSLVSAGTESMLISFGKASLLSKAFREPGKFRLALAKVKSEGLVNTFSLISNQLSQLVPLGYAQAGEVIAVGEGVQGFRVGERVVSNGCHAEVVCVPVNLVAKIPAGVSDEEAAFTVLAAVGLQSIRLLVPTLGETIVVMGFGLIGLLTAELLRINGCHVICIEPDHQRRAFASERGFMVFDNSVKDPELGLSALNDGHGADGVIIATAAKSSSIVSQAARILRKKGRIVLVGTAGLDLDRSEFYKKELSFQVSCSYGPGRYDEVYEDRGIDYPFPHVRWTENRNFQAVLRLLQEGKLEVKSLISKTIDLQDIPAFYDRNDKGNLATMISYPTRIDEQQREELKTFKCKSSTPVIGIIGAGNFVRMTLLPNLKGATIKYIASAGGLSAYNLAKQYRVANPISDYQQILADPDVNVVIIATRHNLHGTLVIKALEAGKQVFVEKPLTIYPKELDRIIEAQQKAELSLSMGFNRRYSPYVSRMLELLAGAQMNVTVTVNAGSLPAGSWLKDPAIGGGRILGEACHFIDLVTCLTNSRVTAVCSNAMLASPGQDCENVSILLRYLNGSTGVVNYFSNGSSHYQKERVEVFSGGSTLVLDDFRCLVGYGFKNFGKLSLGKDKGHKRQFSKFLQFKKDLNLPEISIEEIVNTTRATFAAVESLKVGQWVEV
ncbi:bi-domain-containing oxidoreductase [Dyadobacter crusticola]|uniref:bi-domain-containing oxidoreductase n=1 Tax=Dyadobacter crusticola TaxID=292407 RepID=UPI0004E239B1|nr:bi-domain-containing oxidoreductase [Dyadobacter crusticola]